MSPVASSSSASATASSGTASATASSTEEAAAPTSTTANASAPPPDASAVPTPSSSRPTPEPSYPSPLLRFQVMDLRSPAAHKFLQAVDISTALDKAVKTVLKQLYPLDARSQVTTKPTWPGTRSVTLILDPMDGVAYTTGISLDDDHKEIHLSTKYVAGIAPAIVKEELMGVLVHEMVHCWQWAAFGGANGGLIEGVADWVRLRAGLGARHWKREARQDQSWDAGYQTTAWFLDWLDKEKVGNDLVVRLNAKLGQGKYDEEKFWKELCGHGPKKLWEEYRAWLNEGEGKQYADKGIEVNGPEPGMREVAFEA